MHSQLKALYNEYYSFVHDHPVNVVFNDLKERFYNRTLDSDEALEDIPHPYRQYVALGQRMVIEIILEAAKIIEKGALPEIETDE